MYSPVLMNFDSQGQGTEKSLGLIVTAEKAVRYRPSCLSLL